MAKSNSTAIRHTPLREISVATLYHAMRNALSIILSNASQIWFGVCFSKDDVTLTIDVIEYRSEGEYRIDAYMEKDDEHYEEYAIGENKFIILSNMGRLQGLWLVEPYECIITGDIEPDEMRHIFESIVERS